MILMLVVQVIVLARQLVRASSKRRLAQQTPPENATSSNGNRARLSRFAGILQLACEMRDNIAWDVIKAIVVLLCLAFVTVAPDVFQLLGPPRNEVASPESKLATLASLVAPSNPKPCEPVAKSTLTPSPASALLHIPTITSSPTSTLPPPSLPPTSTPSPTTTPTATPTPTPHCAYLDQPIPRNSRYIVLVDDNLSCIAFRAGVPTEALIAANRDRYPSLITNPHLILPGWVLYIP